MTGYFDALIRASGLASGQPFSAAVSDATGVEPDGASIAPTEVDELDVEDVAPAVAHVEAPVVVTVPSPTPAAPVSVRDQTRNEPVASTAHDVVLRAPDDGTGRQPPTPPPQPAAPTDALAAPPPREAAAPLDHAAIASSRERIVRAAFDWVAADPMGLAISPPAAPDTPTAWPARAPRAAPLLTHEVGARSDAGPRPTESPAQPGGEPVEPAPPLTPGEPPSLAMTPPAHRSIPLEPAVAVARPSPPSNADGRPLDQDDVVEVSIGAIHLRVDAPAPPPAAPAAPAPRPPLSASRPVRDGLRRRALRRI